MRIHEYQAKKILSEFGIPVQKGGVATTSEEVRRIAEQIGTKVVVKAQIHAGGRGRGGGIKFARTSEEAGKVAEEIIGMNLVTPQTGPKGKKVRKVLVAEALDVEKELYLGVVVDRSLGQPVIIGSEAGGMEIEDIAVEHPEKIIRVSVDPTVGFTGFEGRKIVYGLGLEEPLVPEVIRIAKNLYELFITKDASLAEINPLAVTRDKKLIALDAKLEFDDDALYRHPEIMELRDVEEEEPLEREALDQRVSYIKLDGSIGCMVNGAGLAMATMDLIKLAGGRPANFLDVGGGATEEQVKGAFKILTSDPNVRVILINMFGGILRCDRVARGLIKAAEEIGVNLPMVVRLQGTNVEEGRKLLKESGLKFEVAEIIQEAVKKAVELGGSG